MDFPEFVSICAILIPVVPGWFAFVKWRDQRQRELEERRFEQYWKLVDVSQESPHLAKQMVALLLLKRYPEFKNETTEFLTDARARGDAWFSQNKTVIEGIISCF